MQTAQVNFEGGVQVHNEPLVAPNWHEKRYTSHDEFWNEAYADLGKRYGLNDIREAEWSHHPSEYDLLTRFYIYFYLKR